MQVEAIKKENGWFIPLAEPLDRLLSDKVWLSIEILKPNAPGDAYASLDSVIGLCSTEYSDASIQHDARVYREQK